MKKILLSLLIPVSLIGILAFIFFGGHKTEQRLGTGTLDAQPFYQNAGTTVFQFPISVPSCTGCGGGGGGSDSNWTLNGRGVNLTTSTNGVVIGGSNQSDPDSPLYVYSAAGDNSGQISIASGNPDGIAGIEFRAGTGSVTNGAAFVGITGSSTADLPTSTLVLANTKDGANGIAFVGDGNSPGMVLDNQNNLNIGHQYSSDYNGDFGHATYGWSADMSTGMSLVGAGKAVLIAGGGYVMTWAQAGIEALVDLVPYSNGVQSLGSLTAGWNNIFATGSVSSSKMIVGVGTAMLPSITFTGDTDTGLFRSGADTLALTTAGATRATLDNSNFTTNLTFSPSSVAGNNTIDLGRSNVSWRNMYVSSTAFLTNVKTDQTVTPAGTVGTRTINKEQGSVNMATAATSLYVINSTVIANSQINVFPQTNDSSLKSVVAVSTSTGSFTIYPNTPPAAETKIGFKIFN